MLPATCKKRNDRRNIYAAAVRSSYNCLLFASCFGADKSFLDERWICEWRLASHWHHTVSASIQASVLLDAPSFVCDREDMEQWEKWRENARNIRFQWPTTIRIFVCLCLCYCFSARTAWTFVNILQMTIHNKMYVRVRRELVKFSSRLSMLTDFMLTHNTHKQYMKIIAIYSACSIVCQLNDARSVDTWQI